MGRGSPEMTNLDPPQAYPGKGRGCGNAPTLPTSHPKGGKSREKPGIFTDSGPKKSHPSSPTQPNPLEGEGGDFRARDGLEMRNPIPWRIHKGLLKKALWKMGWAGWAGWAVFRVPPQIGRKIRGQDHPRRRERADAGTEGVKIAGERAEHGGIPGENPTHRDSPREIQTWKSPKNRPFRISG